MSNVIVPILFSIRRCAFGAGGSSTFYRCNIPKIHHVAKVQLTQCAPAKVGRIFRSGKRAKSFLTPGSALPRCGEKASPVRGDLSPRLRNPLLRAPPPQRSFEARRRLISVDHGALHIVGHARGLIPPANLAQQPTPLVELLSTHPHRAPYPVSTRVVGIASALHHLIVQSHSVVILSALHHVTTRIIAPILTQ